MKKLNLNITKLLYLTVIAAAVFFVSCSNKDNPTPEPPAIKIESITLDKAELLLMEGEVYNSLIASLQPENATNADIKWSSSDATVATVDGGIITAHKVGKAVISVASITDESKSANCTLEVVTPRQSDSLAIVALYNMFSADEKFRKLYGDYGDWNSDKPMNTWKFIFMGRKGQEGDRILRLTLQEVNLEAYTIPIDIILKLSELKHLIIDNTKLSGTIPPELIRFSKLISLKITRNPNITGEIPKELSKLSLLLTLNLSKNKLSGEIPGELVELEKLINLDLSYNNLTGTIPASFDNFKRGQDAPLIMGLTYLCLTHNRLTGKVSPKLKSEWYEDYFNPQQEGYGLEY